MKLPALFDRSHRSQPVSLLDRLRLPVLRGLHGAAHGILRGAGYRFELRRSGELKIGLWRKSLGTARAGQLQTPRRLVFLPGFGDTPLSWWAVVSTLEPMLRREYDEIVFFDFPGYCGILQRERCFHSMDLLLSSMGDALDSLRPHTILGHSLGGWIAGHYAAACGEGSRDPHGQKQYAGPELLILADPAGVYGDQAARDEYRAKYEAIIEHGFERMRPFVFHREPPWFRWVHPEFVSFIEKPEVVQFMRSVREDHLIEERVEKIRARTWLVWGEHDELTPPSAIAEWRRRLPGVRSVLIRNAGHSPQIERPAITAMVVGQILARGAGETDHRRRRWLESPRAARWWRYEGPAQNDSR